MLYRKAEFEKICKFFVATSAQNFLRRKKAILRLKSLAKKLFKAFVSVVFYVFLQNFIVFHQLFGSLGKPCA